MCFCNLFKSSPCLMNVSSDVRSGAVEIWKLHVGFCHYSCCWVDVLNMWFYQFPGIGFVLVLLSAEMNCEADLNSESSVGSVSR